MTSQHEVWATLQEELNAAGMHVVGYEPLEPEAEAWLDLHFREQIFPADAAEDRTRRTRSRSSRTRG